MEHVVLGWLVRYGAPTLFVVQMLGLVGLPIPDELLLTVAGALVRQGQLRASTTIVAALAGAMSGMTISYALGRLVGLAMLRRRLSLRESAVARAQRWFARFGGWLLAFGYFVPGVRHITAIAAGSAPMDFPTFARYAYAGAALWCSVFLGVGYYAGDRWSHLAPYIRAHTWVSASFAAGGVLAFALAHWIVNRRRPRNES